MSNELLADALDVVLQWGPERAVPERDRLREKQPDVPDDELDMALHAAYSVLGQAEALAPGMKQGRIHDGTERLKSAFPWIDDESASRAIQQGLYFHWRDEGW